MIDLVGVDELLGTLAALGNVPLSWESFPEVFTALGRNCVTVVSIDEVDHDSDEEPLLTEATAMTRVSVDAAAVLAETLGPRGFRIGAPRAPDGLFIPLAHDALPAYSDAYFATDLRAPLYAARALSSSTVTVVVHVTEPQDEAVLNAMGVYPIRLRELNSSGLQGHATSLEKLSALRSAVAVDEDPIDASTVDAVLASHKDVSPDDVIIYATTRQDQLFESAVARILAPLTKVFPLGGKYTGRPFPDGLILDTATTGGPQVAHYDCKSKKEDYYGLDSIAGDQQNRYLMIARRLEESGWKGRGTLLFTPTVDVTTFNEKIEKDCWRQLRLEGRRLIVVPASALLKWHRLSEAEGAERMQSLFSPHAFWKALFDGELPGISEAVASRVWPTRTAWATLFGEDQAELCFLAGLSARPSYSEALPLALGRADPDRPAPSEITRSALIANYHRVLRHKVSSLEALALEVGLSESATTYLVKGNDFAPRGQEEAGIKGFEHLARLKQALD